MTEKEYKKAKKKLRLALLYRAFVIIDYTLFWQGRQKITKGNENHFIKFRCDAEEYKELYQQYLDLRYTHRKAKLRKRTRHDVGEYGSV